MQQMGMAPPTPAPTILPSPLQPMVSSTFFSVVIYDYWMFTLWLPPLAKNTQKKKNEKSYETFSIIPSFPFRCFGVFFTFSWFFLSPVVPIPPLESRHNSLRRRALQSSVHGAKKNRCLAWESCYLVLTFYRALVDLTFCAYFTVARWIQVLGSGSGFGMYSESL